MTARGVRAEESVVFWLDSDRDGVRDRDERDLDCDSLAQADNTATCAVVMANPPFRPGRVNFVNFRDGEGRRLGSTDRSDELVPISPGPDNPGYTVAGGYPDIARLIANATVELEPLVTISPGAAKTGDRVNITLFDFPEGDVESIRINNILVAHRSAPGPARLSAATGEAPARSTSASRYRPEDWGRRPVTPLAEVPGWPAAGSCWRLPLPAPRERAA